MYNFGELDKPLNFHGDSEIDSQHIPIAPTIGLDRSIHQSSSGDIDAPAAAARTIKDRTDFGKDGGKAANAYYRGAKALLHHQQMYAPCKIISPEDYEKLK